MRYRCCLPILATLLAPPTVFAARPLVTDDARLTDARACQMESWFHIHHDSTELWALPACNPGGNFELTIGEALSRAAGHTDNNGAFLIQGKTLFKPLETNGYGVGLAVGYSTELGSGEGRSAYFYVPTSISFANDRFVLHTNLGAVRELEGATTRLTWGIGSETQTTDRLFIIAETYGQNKGSPFFQMGLRYWIIPNHVQVDTTFGSQIGHLHDERWVSIGLRLITPPLF